MATTTKTKAPTKPVKAKADEFDTATALADLARKAKKVRFSLYIVGDTPLIAHAWSEKAKREMLAKQMKLTQDAKEARSPEDDFHNSLYRIPTSKGDVYGFPAMAFKNAIVAGAHKDKGIAKTNVNAELWIDGEMVRVHTAHKAAICDMPLVRLYSGGPEMREDMVRIGQGLKKTASLAYRGQFTDWAILLTGRVNTNVIPLDALKFLIGEAGFACGVGEWRNEKSGMFGAFHLATTEEEAAWERFIAGKGPLPERNPLLKAA